MPLDPRCRPALLISCPRSEDCAQEILILINDLSPRDDVYSEDFRSTIIIQTSATATLQDSSVDTAVWRHMFSEILYSTVTCDSMLLPVGPYFVCGLGIHEAWRLYPDHLDAFEIPTIPNANHGPERRTLIPSSVLYTTC